ncbi:MAG: recombinase family protein [Rhodobacterales bacterium]|nr:recombinase family protein [Rhodobacterales bacterium]
MKKLTDTTTRTKVEKLKKLAVGYIRVSIQEQADSGSGLKAQEDQIREWSASHGYTVDHIFEDTHTGKGPDSLVQRLGLQDAIKTAETEGIAIVVTSVDRLTRHDDTLQLLLKKKKLRVISIKDDLLLDHTYAGPAGVDAEKEGDRISAATKKTHDHQKAGGAKLGNVASLPLARKNSQKSRSDKSYNVVLEIADFLQAHPGYERLPCRALAEKLNAAGSRSSRGLEWTKGSLRDFHTAAKEEILVRNELSALPDDFVSVSPTPEPIIPQDTDTPEVELDEVYKTNPKFGMF